MGMICLWYGYDMGMYMGVSMGMCVYMGFVWGIVPLLNEFYPSHPPYSYLPGLCAFRQGMYKQAYEGLSGVCGGRVREFLAQGPSRQVQWPYTNMHIHTICHYHTRRHHTPYYTHQHHPVNLYRPHTPRTD
ncbi:hypothetical protein EON63_14195 [archaeon]|nr:MAG: hypothetical protein EON63_14195 [archaeon]